MTSWTPRNGNAWADIDARAVLTRAAVIAGLVILVVTTVVLSLAMSGPPAAVESAPFQSSVNGTSAEAPTPGSTSSWTPAPGLGVLVPASTGPLAANDGPAAQQSSGRQTPGSVRSISRTTPGSDTGTPTPMSTQVPVIGGGGSPADTSTGAPAPAGAILPTRRAAAPASGRADVPAARPTTAAPAPAPRPTTAAPAPAPRPTTAAPAPAPRPTTAVPVPPPTTTAPVTTPPPPVAEPAPTTTDAVKPGKGKGKGPKDPPGRPGEGG